MKISSWTEDWRERERERERDRILSISLVYKV
jgi:hypothetical protein